MTEYYNLPTVCVVLLPLKHGLLLIRRNREGDDGYGQLALPGGFQKGDQKQNLWAAACEEVLEETGILMNRENLRLIDADTDEYGHNVLFFQSTLLPCSVEYYMEGCHCIDDEVSEYVYVTEPVETAFPMHTEQIRKFFERKQNAKYSDIG